MSELENRALFFHHGNFFAFLILCSQPLFEIYLSEMILCFIQSIQANIASEDLQRPSEMKIHIAVRIWVLLTRTKKSFIFCSMMEHIVH